MHAKSGLRVVLEWKIYRPDSVIAAVIQQGREDMLAAAWPFVLVFLGLIIQEHDTN